MIERFTELSAAIRSGDLGRAQQYLAEDFELSGAAPETVGRDEATGYWQAMLQAFPDFAYNPTEVRDEGDRLTGYVQVTGTHAGEFDLPPLARIEPTARRIMLPRERFELEHDGDRFTRWHIEKADDGGLAGIVRQLTAAAGERNEVGHDGDPAPEPTTHAAVAGSGIERGLPS
jgi:hypothetical protein